MNLCHSPLVPRHINEVSIDVKVDVGVVISAQVDSRDIVPHLRCFKYERGKATVLKSNTVSNFNKIESSEFLITSGASLKVFLSRLL